MKILFLGDVHCSWNALNRVIFRALERHPDIDALIQVGDLGYAWPRSRPFKFDRRMCDTTVAETPDAVFEQAQKLPFHWIDGNHENFDQLEIDSGTWQPGMTYRPRGNVCELAGGKRALFFGGASSIDKSERIQHRSWWPQESITQLQVANTLKRPGPIDIIVSHEYPLSFPYHNYNDSFGKSDRMGLDALLEHFKPKFWVFGHHHEYKQAETGGTQWACAPIIDSHQAILWDGNELTLLECYR